MRLRNPTVERLFRWEWTGQPDTLAGLFDVDTVTLTPAYIWETEYYGEVVRATPWTADAGGPYIVELARLIHYI